MLGRRVDTLHLQGSLRVYEQAYARLEKEKERLKGTGQESAPFELAGIQFAIFGRGAKDKPFRLANADCTVLVGYGPHNLRVEFGAVVCATHPLRQLVQRAEQIADALGSFADNDPGLVVARIDLAVDVCGVDFTVDDRESFISRSKGGTDYHGEVDVHWKTGDHELAPLTGFSFSRGNPLSARLYRKDVELERYADDHEKLAIEHARWRDAGWVEGQPVWRFEAQIRGEAATELNL
ncbi:MAG: hypothetical protein EB084_20425, partial [Proteobacteria bacterium]|nr:hypothetical protein [Pseudomonadota bacterium]